jgi:hypothetical protein
VTNEVRVEAGRRSALVRMSCPDCGLLVRPSSLARHVIAAHTRTTLPPGSMTEAEFERFLAKIEVDESLCQSHRHRASDSSRERYAREMRASGVRRVTHAEGVTVLAVRLPRVLHRPSIGSA